MPATIQTVMTVLLAAATVVVTLWAVFEVLSRCIRTLLYHRQKCPHCGARYTWKAAWQSRWLVQHVSWEPGAQPRLGGSEGSIRRLKCSSCERTAVFDLHGNRYDMMEG